MGDRRFGIVLVVAVLVALGAAFGVFRFMQNAQNANRVPMQSIVVAALDLAEGHIVAPADVKLSEVPVTSVPPGAYATVDSVVGRVTRIPVFATEALVPGRLAPVGAGAGLEVKITPGKRAMAVRIDDVAGLSGLIQPNSRVDVLVTMTKDEGEGTQQRAKLFMSNMRVLSVGTQIERGADGRPISAPTAALEVTPTEAEQLAVATGQGRIQLVLRGFGDPDTVDTRGASLNDISLGRSPNSSNAAPAPVRERPAPRRESARPAPQPVAQAPLPVAPMPVAPRAPRGPDSAMVQVYRGNGVTQQRIEKRDTTKP